VAAGLTGQITRFGTRQPLPVSGFECQAAYLTSETINLHSGTSISSSFFLAITQQPGRGEYAHALVPEIHQPRCRRVQHEALGAVRSHSMSETPAAADRHAAKVNAI